MTEITRVPLQPVAKGSVTKIWIGIIVAIVLAIGVAYAARYHGLVVETLKAGEGPSPTAEDVVLVNYVGRLKDGSEFDRGEKVALPLSQMIPGFTQGVERMQKGGSYKLEIPSNLGYGADEKRDGQGKVVIPANSDLVFDIDLIDFMNAQQLQAMQQMQAQMGQSAGGPGGAGGPPSPKH
ncbi:FKBP-type peptidyl-prolyl cis-trans isomerase [Novosphingobium sp. ZN18A2]|uniref:FKBP-type peptidyl-prolyl cis-trans isomerase n=1 Tax=Novosphingobium sp. ZN18A2 TaxID=3079861 RepID=UPI0030D480B5